MRRLWPWGGAGAILAIALSIATAGGEVLVIDGDTLKLGEETIRLHGIDAPELAQVCEGVGRVGELARQALTEAVSEGVSCSALSTDRYGRTVALCRSGGRDVAEVMVRHGWARDWPRYSQGAYAEVESEAKAARRGMWAGECQAPWEWRQKRR